MYDSSFVVPFDASRTKGGGIKGLEVSRSLGLKGLYSSLDSRVRPSWDVELSR